MDDAHFHSYWEEWERKLAEVARRGSAQVEFPPLEGPSQQADGTFIYKPKNFLVLHNVKQKGASNRSPRFTIFIDGGFRFARADGRLSMVSASANISIFSLTTKNEDITAMLFDALHFDFEEADGQKPYHPIFHVQRGSNNRLTDNIVIDAIRRKRGALVQVKMEPSKVHGSHHLRIPVPQLDYFSVIVMVVADFFCNPEEKDRNKNMEVIFKDILGHLCDERNIAKEGASSQILFGRNQNRGWNSSADWYVESVA